jgi:diketogulonate reductase-like aldo/keto reductase
MAIELNVARSETAIPNTCAKGAGIPCIGFGTYSMGGLQLSRILAQALRAGFRHIDTAQAYDNEDAVGAGIAMSGIRRDDVFITTKVWVSNYPKERFDHSVDQSLRDLKTDYIDLLLLHWPSETVRLEEQIGLLNQAVQAGKVLSIGVSNFNKNLFERAVEASDIPLATNQIEYHPYLNQSTLVASARDAGAAITAYCAMAVGRVFHEPVLRAIAQKYGRTVSQIVLRWLVQQDGLVTLSRTTHEQRIAENLTIFDFTLEEEDMKRIFGLADPMGRIVAPPNLSPKWDPTPAY